MVYFTISSYATKVSASSKIRTLRELCRIQHTFALTTWYRAAKTSRRVRPRPLAAEEKAASGLYCALPNQEGLPRERVAGAQNAKDGSKFRGRGTVQTLTVGLCATADVSGTPRATQSATEDAMPASQSAVVGAMVRKRASMMGDSG